MPYLVIKRNGHKKKEIELGAITTIGRLGENSLQILDELVSKRHAVIFKKGSSYFIKDLNSRNGTYLNDKKIETVHILKDGDVLVIGNTELKFVEKKKNRRTTDLTINQPAKPSTLIKRKVVTESTGKFVPVKNYTNVENLKEDYERLRILFGLMNRLVNIFSEKQLFDEVIKFVFFNMPVERVAFLEKKDGKWIVVRSKSVFDSPSSTQNFSISSTILEEVEHEQNAVLSYDASVDSRFQGSHSIMIQGIKSLICVPILVQNEVKYILYLDSLVSKGAFTKKDLQILSNVSGFLSIMFENTMLLHRIKDETRKRAVFERLFSPNIVDKIIAGELSVESAPELKNISVLFLDIRNFVKLTENMEPEQVFIILNEFFELMAEVIFSNKGTLDKYMGDAVMAFWGAPVETEDPEFRALLAAKQMMEIAKSYGEHIKKYSGHDFKVGIGINSGPTIVGYVGSSRTLSYTVIGKNVNIASRLCSIARGDEILIGYGTYKKLKDRIVCEKIENIHIRGLSTPFPVYKFIDFK